MSNDLFESDEQDASFIDLGETPMLEAHAADMHGAFADPEQTPKAPDGTAEPVVVDGKPIDIMGDTPVLDDDLRAVDVDPLGSTGQMQVLDNDS